MGGWPLFFDLGFLESCSLYMSNGPIGLILVSNGLDSTFASIKYSVTVLGYKNEVFSYCATKIILADIKAPTLIRYLAKMDATSTAFSKGIWFSFKYGSTLIHTNVYQPFASKLKVLRKIEGLAPIKGEVGPGARISARHSRTSSLSTSLPRYSFCSTFSSPRLHSMFSDQI